MKTRIFVDAHVFDKGFQGTRTFISGIYKEMLKMPGLEIFFGAQDINNLQKEFQHPKARFIQLKTNSSWKRLATEIPYLTKKYKIDYAHFQYIVPPVKNCKFIVTTHDVIFNNYPEYFSRFYRLKKNFLYGNSLRRSDIITTVSDFSKNSIHNYFDIPLKSISITPNGVAPAYFEDYEKENEKSIVKRKYGFDRFILYVSRVEPRKNHVQLLKAYLELELYKQGYHLVFIGSETIKSTSFNRLLGQLSPEILSFINWEQSVSEKELLSFYRAADVFVYPSLAEGFGIPPLEAAAVGIPVLCSNYAALGDFDFFPHHIDPKQNHLFREKLKELVQQSALTKELQDISSIVQANYNWPRSAQILYNTICLHSRQNKHQQHDQFSIT